MNIFVTDPSPTVSAQVLPDKHVVKMPLESCQMLAIVCSEKWGHGYGEIHKKNGEPYKLIRVHLEDILAPYGQTNPT